MTYEFLAKIVIKNEMYVDWKTTPVTSEHFERDLRKFKEIPRKSLMLLTYILRT